MKHLITVTGIAASLLAACSTAPAPTQSADEAAINNAHEQMMLQIEAIEADTTTFLNPVTTGVNRMSTQYCGLEDWRAGFFPGNVWYLYELTGDSTLLPLAKKYTDSIAPDQYLTSHHDIGFIINCSFGNGRRLTDNADYDTVMVNAAKSLCTRFRPGAGIIQSWNVEPGSWQEQRDWVCPVIIDNMMNLELLFEAANITGDTTFTNVAVSHANRTLTEHFRPDGSCFHVIDYDPVKGDVRHRMTAQGCADSSAWSRGQGWAIYGFTMCYRYTGDKRYLEQAEKTFNFVKNHPNLPADKIPYWDMDAPDIPQEPRDVSAATIIATALYELSTYPVNDPAACRQFADDIMASLATDEYTAKPGTNGRFILMHSVGAIPHNFEIDVPLVYADYYYLEALKRKHDLDAK